MNPLVKAAYEANNKQALETTKAVVAQVPATGSLHVDKVIFINPPRLETGWFGPSKKDVEAATKMMATCYANIFAAFKNAAAGEKNAKEEAQKGTGEIAIPAFNVSKGGIPPKEGAKVAVSKAVEFLKANPNAKVHFVCYEGDNAGRESYAQYQTSIKAAVDQDPSIADRINVTSGNIEDVDDADAIVCPILGDFSVAGSGPIANKICSLAAKSNVVQQPVAKDIRGIQ